MTMLEPGSGSNQGHVICMNLNLSTIYIVLMVEFFTAKRKLKKSI